MNLTTRIALAMAALFLVLALWYRQKANDRYAFFNEEVRRPGVFHDWNECVHDKHACWMQLGQRPLPLSTGLWCEP